MQLLKYIRIIAFITCAVFTSTTIVEPAPAMLRVYENGLQESARDFPPPPLSQIPPAITGQILSQTPVYSLGGNSLLLPEDNNTLKPWEDNDWAKIRRHQKARILETLTNMVDSLSSGGIITHGNGPEVGTFLERMLGHYLDMEKDQDEVKQHLPFASEYTQQWIGDDIFNVLRMLHIPAEKIEIVITHVTVDAADEGFQNPTKPIGIQRFDAQGRRIKRPTVASPKPLRIVEIEEIRELVLEGKIVICVGGGGIPVDSANIEEKLPAVIDKDLALARLVQELAVPGQSLNRVVISTDVPCVYHDFGTPDEEPITTIAVDDLKAYMARGEFASAVGSMYEKLLAAVAMVESGAAKEVIITNPENMTSIDSFGLHTRVVQSEPTTQAERFIEMSPQTGFFKSIMSDEGFKQRIEMQGGAERVMTRFIMHVQVIEEEEDVDTLLLLLERSNSLIGVHIVKRLMKLELGRKKRRVARVLINTLDDNNNYRKREPLLLSVAAEAIGIFKPKHDRKQAIDVLQKVLSYTGYKEEDIARNAAWSLGEIGSSSEIKVLDAVKANHRLSAVQRAAEQAIKKIKKRVAANKGKRKTGKNIVISIMFGLLSTSLLLSFMSFVDKFLHPAHAKVMPRPIPGIHLAARTERPSGTGKFSDYLQLQLYLQEAQDALVKGDYRQAVQWYKKAALLDPQNVDIQIRLAHLYYVIDKFEDAIRIYKKIIGIDPNNESIYIQLGLLYLQMSDPEQAITYLEKAIMINEQNIQSHIALGVAYIEIKEYKKALEKYNDAAKINPKDMFIERGRGDAYYYLGEFDKAIKAYKQALAINQNDIMTYYNLGITYMEGKMYLEAIETLQEVVARDSGSAFAYYNLGKIYAILGRYKQAVEAFEKAVYYEPAVPVFHNQLALSYYECGDFKKAHAALERAIELYPDNAEFHYNLGRMYFEQGLFEQAVKFYTQAVILAPQNEAYASNLEEAQRRLRATPALPEPLPVPENSHNSLIEIERSFSLYTMEQDKEVLAALQEGIAQVRSILNESKWDTWHREYEWVRLSSGIRRLGQTADRTSIISPLATKNRLILQGTLMHEHVHYRLHDKGYSNQLQDVIAGVIEMRYIYTESYRIDEERIANGEDIALGTTLNEALQFLLKEKQHIPRTSRVRLLRFLQHFSMVQGATLEKQVQAIKEVVSCTPYHSSDVDKNFEQKYSMQDTITIIKDLEKQMLKKGTFDAAIEHVNEKILSSALNNIWERFMERKGKRAVILVDPYIELLDPEMIAALLNEDRILYILSDVGFSKVSIVGGVIAREFVAAVHTLDEAITLVKDAETEVRVISPYRKRLVDEITYSSAEVLRFSTEEAYIRAEDEHIANVSFEMLFLPFVFNIDTHDIGRHEGINRPFLKKGSVWVFNVGYVANFGENLKAAYAHVMQKIKATVVELAVGRQIQTAA